MVKLKCNLLVTMEVWVRSDGQRDREFRPYIDQEESDRSVPLYDPNNGFHYGLYQTAQPTCMSFSSMLQQYQQYSDVPAAVVDVTGRMHRVRPEWYRNGFRYASLTNQARPPYI